MERLVQAELAIEVDLLPRQVRHAARRVLEAQHQAALEVVLRALQLAVGDRRLLDRPQLVDDEVHDFAHGLVGAAGVDRELAGVAIRAQSAEHRVGQAALLPHVLEEPRAHRAAEQRVEHVARVAVLVALRITRDPRQMWLCSSSLLRMSTFGATCGASSTVRLADRRDAAELLRHQIPHALVLEVAHGRHDQVARRVGVREIAAEQPAR